jgi:hypothetical protein
VILGNPDRRVSSFNIDLNHGCSPACAFAGVTPALNRASTCIQRVRRSNRRSKPGIACAVNRLMRARITLKYGKAKLTAVDVGAATFLCYAKLQRETWDAN